MSGNEEYKISLSGEGISVEKTLKKAQLRFNQWLNIDESERNVEMLLEKMNLTSSYYIYYSLIVVTDINRC